MRAQTHNIFKYLSTAGPLEKLSTKYIECEANNRLKLGKKKFEDSDMKNKIDKFKGSKTLSDLIKK